MKTFTDLALDVARSGGATYADIRIVEERATRIVVQRRALKGIESTDTFGYGVRVLVHGAWGFASHTDLTRDAVVRTAEQALATARASALAPKDTPARMAAEAAHIDTRPVRAPRTRSVCRSPSRRRSCWRPATR